jgi:uncharacterized phage-associated protein
VSDGSVEQLAAVVHYVIAKADGHDIGKTKLNKILWFADCAAWRSHGRTITGLNEYVKLQYGPVPPRIDMALSYLGREGRADLVHQYVGPYIRLSYRPLVEPQQNNHIAPLDRQILDDVIEAVRPMTAFDVSELSHDALWHATPYGQKISVAAAAVQHTPPDERIREWARNVRR